MKNIKQKLIVAIILLSINQNFAQNQVYWKESFDPNASSACNLTTVQPTSFTKGYFQGNAGIWYGAGIFRTIGTGCPAGNSHLRFKNISGITDSGFVVTPIVSAGIEELHFVRARASRSYTIWITADTNANTTNWVPLKIAKSSQSTITCQDTAIIIHSQFAKRLKIVARPGTDTDIDSIWMTSYSKFRDCNIKGNVFEDLNSNGIKDLSERSVLTVVQSIRQDSSFYASLSVNGHFSTRVDTGNFITSIPSLYKPYYICNPVLKYSHLDTTINSDSVDFALVPIANKNDLKIGMYSPSLPRLGRAVEYYLGYVNVGTTTQNAKIVFVKDPRINNLVTTPNFTSQSGDSLFWNLSNLTPDSMGYIKILAKIAIPPVAKVFDTLKHFVSISSTSIDETPNNNKQFLLQRIIGAYDPNDIQEVHNGILSTTQVANREDLLYTIRFQNTGNDTAFNIVVTDELDNKLDISSFEIVAKSHPCVATINDRKLTFTFDNIYLADSNINEPESHGFIVYRIKTKPNLVAGDSIKNSAAIYFDFNDAVLTNIHKTTITNTVLATNELTLTGSVTKDNIVTLNLLLNKINSGKIALEKSNDGRNYQKLKTIDDINEISIKFSDILLNNSTVFYRAFLTTNEGNTIYSNVVLLSKKTAVNYSIFPNPAKDKIVIQITKNTNSNNVKAGIYSADGRLYKNVLLNNNATNTLNISDLPNGLFTILFADGESLKFMKL